MQKKPYSTLIPICLAAVVACGALAYFAAPVYGLILGGGTVLLAAVSFGLLASYHKQARQLMDEVFGDNRNSARDIAEQVGVPALLYDENGRIVWANAALRELYTGTEVKKLAPSLDVRSPLVTAPLERGGRSFILTTMPLERSHARRLTFLYLLDRTEALHYSRLYEENMPTVALIYVDNYEELNADKQFHRNAVLSDVEKRVSEFVNSIEGVYRRYDSSKFFVIFEAKYIDTLQKHRFSLLDSVRSIDTGTGQPVTLSIAVGIADRIAKSDEASRQAMELALGRGGDQAVVKSGGSYSFYGGKRIVTTRNSRVKTRLFAKALRQLLEYSDQCFIMGHRHPDMDCMGAGLGLMRCAMSVGCRAYLVLDESNPTIQNALDNMRGVPAYHDCVKTPEQALGMMRSGAVLIVVDTQRRSSVIAPELYDKAMKTVVIDHHRMSVDALPNPTLNYLEAGSSSACEMVTEVMQYFDDSLRPTAFESGALLAGITVDTKHFLFSTGSRTFEAASYLRRNGADNSSVSLMFQDDMQIYRNRARVVENALIMEHGIAISSCPDGMDNAALIAAQASDALCGIKGIQASFVLANVNNTIMISGRSLGKINVQLILEKLGGGGHLTIAGAQLHDVDLDAAIQRLTTSIEAYLMEAKLD